MSDGPVRGLIVAHSSLASALATAVRQIAGVDEGVLRTISNEGRGPEQLLEFVREAAGDDPVIIFTDLASGSCAFAARKIALDRPATGIVSGVNLPLLLDFVFHRDLPLQALVDRLVEKGRGGISGACTEEGARADRALSR
jgi:mannose/fructose-specific phosphotransferase system component IIA